MVACGSTQANKNMFKVGNNKALELLQLTLPGDFVISRNLFLKLVTESAFSKASSLCSNGSDRVCDISVLVTLQAFPINMKVLR